jgi:hypothetical protein
LINNSFEQEGMTGARRADALYKGDNKINRLAAFMLHQQRGDAWIDPLELKQHIHAFQARYKDCLGKPTLVYV